MPLVIIFAINAIVWGMFITPLQGSAAQYGAIFMTVMNVGGGIYAYFYL